MDINVLDVTEEFTSKISGDKVGIYRIKIKEGEYTVVRNGIKVMVITHFFTGTELKLATVELTNALIELLDTQ